ncbi:MAG: hypothetical protein NC123_11485 [Butyrivibrio sp.]|nr:hypothetical protein [Acetatifactor muris]MCM1560146.1 hypothetical protein [Butyrivibrio sp.]
MRQRFLLFLTVGMVLGLMILGIVKRQTYTDMTKQEGYLPGLQVGELPEDFAQIQCDRLSESLPEAPVILKVEATGELEHLFHVDRQRAVIREVYAGGGLEQGEEIYLYSVHWSLLLEGDLNALERGYVNILETGTEYLVFAEAVTEDPTETPALVKLYDDFAVAPVFCCEERQNVAIPTGEFSTYVPYGEVMGNEFFATSERVLQLLEELKERMLELYICSRGG